MLLPQLTACYFHFLIEFVMQEAEAAHAQGNADDDAMEDGEHLD